MEQLLEFYSKKSPDCPKSVWTLNNDVFVFAEEFVGGQRCGSVAARALHLRGLWLR